MDALAEAQDAMLERLAQSGRMSRCEPRLNEARDPEYWLAQPGAPKPELADEEGQGRTIDYDELLENWRKTGA